MAKIKSTILWGILAALCFSLMGLFVKLCDLSVAQLILFRSIFIVGASIVSFKGKISAEMLGLKSNRTLLLARGLAGTGALFFSFYALQHLPITLAALIKYMAPIFASLAAYFVVGERSDPRQWICLILGLAGIGIATGHIPVATASVEPLNLWHLISGIAGAVSAGIAYAIVRRLNLQNERADVIVFYFPMVAIPLALIVGWKDLVWPDPLNWLWAGLVCLFSYLGQILLTMSLAGNKTSEASSTLYLGFIFATIWGLVIFKESLDWHFWIGATVIIASQIWSVQSKVKPQPKA